MELRAEEIAKWYYRKNGESNRFFAVKETNFSAAGGGLTVLMGRSGSGKTTFLHMLGGLLVPDSGKITVDGTDLYAMGDAELSRYRNRTIGLIPQGHAAVQSLNVLENVMLPGLMYSKTAEFGDRAEQLLTHLEISHLREAYPAELSGGELRRMSVARALAGNPGIILADEPTGDLDDESTETVMNALRESANEGKIVIIVTHESDALRFADRCFHMSAGELYEDCSFEIGSNTKGGKK